MKQAMEVSEVKQSAAEPVSGVNFEGKEKGRTTDSPVSMFKRGFLLVETGPNSRVHKYVCLYICNIF